MPTYIYNYMYIYIQLYIHTYVGIYFYIISDYMCIYILSYSITSGSCIFFKGPENSGHDVAPIHANGVASRHDVVPLVVLGQALNHHVCTPVQRTTDHLPEKCLVKGRA